MLAKCLLVNKGLIAQVATCHDETGKNRMLDKQRIFDLQSFELDESGFRYSATLGICSRDKCELVGNGNHLTTLYAMS